MSLAHKASAARRERKNVLVRHERSRARAESQGEEVRERKPDGLARALRSSSQAAKASPAHARSTAARRDCVFVHCERREREREEARRAQAFLGRTAMPSISNRTPRGSLATCGRRARCRGVSESARETGGGRRARERRAHLDARTSRLVVAKHTRVDGVDLSTASVCSCKVSSVLS